MRLNTVLCSLFLSLLFVSSPDKAEPIGLTGQIQTTGSIEGIVTGPDSAVLTGVTVTATNKQTGKTVSAQTDDEGRFSLRDLPPGIYKVEVTSTGFKTFTVDNVSVNLSGTSVLNIPLADPVTDSIAGKIKGKVTNRRGAQPIENGNITIKQLGNEKTYDGIKTDSQGKYEKAGLVPDRYKVRAEASGFRPSEQTIRLGVRQVKEVNFKLTPQ